MPTIEPTCGCDSEGEALTTSQAWLPSATAPITEADPKWYAVQTRARHEKVIAKRLREKGLTTFLPLVSEVHRWSDRWKRVELPLFSCYIFVKLIRTSRDRLWLSQVDGVFGIVGVRGEGTPIPDEQIKAVRALVAQRLPWSFHPFLKIGQQVRIRGGSLDGVEGVLLSRSGDRTLIISVDAIQRSLAVRIEGYEVEPL